jgi:hypothetical protein
MMVKMFQNLIAATALIAAGLLIGCGTSTTGPDGGSRYQTQHGVSGSSDYPAGKPVDANSPALASSSESQYSRDQQEKPAESTPSH